MILYDSRPFDWTVSEVAKVCAVRNTPEHEFALSSTSPSDWYPSTSRTAASVRVRGSGHCSL